MQVPLMKTFIFLNLILTFLILFFFSNRRSPTSVHCVLSHSLHLVISSRTCTFTTGPGPSSVISVTEDSRSKPTSRTTCSYIVVINHMLVHCAEKGKINCLTVPSLHSFTMDCNDFYKIPNWSIPLQ